MATRYVKSKTSRLYEAPTGGSRKMILIFGDDVETTGPAVGNRVPVTFRGRPGFMTENQLGSNPALELYFIDVGQGDSTFIVTPSRKKILIDGGVNRRALGFLAWKYRLDQPGPSLDIDLLVLSHADGDHLNGLIPIISHPRINVQHVVHNGIATFSSGAFGTALGDLDPTGTFLTTRHSSLGDLAGLSLSDSFADWRDAISAEGCTYAAVDVGTGSLDIGEPGIDLEVIGPRPEVVGGQPVFRWFGNASHTINGHSVILRLSYGQVSVLLTGDLNIEGAEHLLADPVLPLKLDAHVFKAPHHGSHEYHSPLLEAIRPQISVISSGDEPDHGHPRASFVGGVGRASRSSSPLVFSTEIAATFVEARSAAPAGEAVEPVVGMTLEGADLRMLERGDFRMLESVDFRTLEANVLARQLFKRRLHGMINVRTDGQALYAARRVASGYWWESYGPVAPAP